MHGAAIIMIVTCGLAALVLQVMMSANTKSRRAGNNVMLGLWVDGSEFNERGLKYRDWRRTCLIAAFATAVARVVAHSIASTP